MAQSPDHPELRFVQAQDYTRGRPDGPPLFIVIHDMEAGESSDRAENTAAYFASGSGGRNVSAHYCVDDNSIVQCVKLGDVAWTVGNRPGNNRGINWELSGFARQTRAQWLDAFGRAMFARMAPYVRADAAKYKIPLRRCTIADLKAFRPGITSHNDLRLAFGGTTHTDPGPNFPWDVFMQIMQQEGDDMADIKQADWDALIWRVHALVNNLEVIAGGPAGVKGQPNHLAVKINQMARDLTELKGRPPVIAGPVDETMLKDAQREVMLELEVIQAYSKEINDEDARRQVS